MARVEFKGAVLVLDGFNGGFSLTVAGETLTFAPQTSVPDKSDKVINEKDGNYFYRLRFSRDIPWSINGQKINVIKCVRSFTGMGLGEAKALVEGSGSNNYIKGPKWEMSEFLRELTNYISKEHIVTEPVAWHQTVSPMSYT